MSPAFSAARLLRRWWRMGRAWLAGIIGGLAGGLAAGALLTVMTQTGSSGPQVTVMELIAAAIGATSLLGPWLLVLGMSAVLGAVFGLVAGTRDRDAIAGAGVFYLLALWLLASLVALPLALGLAPIVSVRAPELWPWLPGTLVAAIAFTSPLTAIVIARPQRRRTDAVARDRELRRAA